MKQVQASTCATHSVLGHASIMVSWPYVNAILPKPNYYYYYFTTTANSGDSIEGELDGGKLEDSPPQPCPELQVQQRISPLLTYGAEHKQTEFFFPWDLQVGQVSADFHEAG